jgi:hypothetical protein
MKDPKPRHKGTRKFAMEPMQKEFKKYATVQGSNIKPIEDRSEARDDAFLPALLPE